MFKVSLKTELEKSKIAITMQKSEATTVSGNIFKSITIGESDAKESFKN